MQKRNFKRGAIALLALCILVFSAITAVNHFLPSNGPSALGLEMPVFEVEETPPHAPATPEPEPTPEPPEEPEPEEEPEEEEEEYVERTSLPARMRIPALSLDYDVRSMGADASGTMLIAPALEVISWFDRSAIPGNHGNAIFGGHNLWQGRRSQIYTLDELEIGDELEIEYEDGTISRWYMESVFVYELRLAPAHLIMDTEGEQRLTLITCKPPFNPSRGTSDNRIVAIFKEESIFEIPDPPIEKYPPRDPPLW